MPTTHRDRKRLVENEHPTYLSRQFRYVVFDGGPLDGRSLHIHRDQRMYAHDGDDGTTTRYSATGRTVEGFRVYTYCGHVCTAGGK